MTTDKAGLTALDFATAESTRQRIGEGGISWAGRTFLPVFPGVHICGADHEENRFFTIANFPARTDAEAKTLWERLRSECEVDQEAGDFVVDLNTDEGSVDDFWSNRQNLPRIAALASKEPEHG